MPNRTLLGEGLLTNPVLHYLKSLPETCRFALERRVLERSVPVRFAKDASQILPVELTIHPKHQEDSIGFRETIA